MTDQTPTLKQTAELVPVLGGSTLDTIDPRLAIASLDDDQLTQFIGITRAVEFAGRLARIERGRRHENLRGQRNDLTYPAQQDKFTKTVLNTRTEERTVAAWYDANEAVALKFVQESSWKDCVAAARAWNKSGSDAPPPDFSALLRKFFDGLSRVQIQSFFDSAKDAGYEPEEYLTHQDKALLATYGDRLVREGTRLRNLYGSFVEDAEVETIWRKDDDGETYATTA